MKGSTADNNDNGQSELTFRRFNLGVGCGNTPPATTNSKWVRFVINMLVAMMILCLGVTSPLYLGQYIHPTLSVPVNGSSVKILDGFALSKKTRINIGVSQNQTLFTDFRRYNKFGFTGVSFNLILQESKLLASLWPVIMKKLDREYLEIAGPRVLSIGEIYNNSLVNNAKI